MSRRTNKCRTKKGAPEPKFFQIYRKVLIWSTSLFYFRMCVFGATNSDEYQNENNKISAFSFCPFFSLKPVVFHSPPQCLEPDNFHWDLWWKVSHDLCWWVSEALWPDVLEHIHQSEIKFKGGRLEAWPLLLHLRNFAI